MPLWSAQLKTSDTVANASAPSASIERIHGLDALRGAAALAVVFNHWKHFDNNLPPVSEVDRSAAPFYALARPFYEHGWVAVDLFFGISGFIFAYYYAESIRAGRLGCYDFFLRRVSRLYPLFLLTTLMVAAMQYYSLARHGYGIVYLNTDIFHLALSLAFASAWGAEAGPSFNGPSWSISVEMLLYAVFFAVALTTRKQVTRLVVLIAAVVFGAFVQMTVSPYVGRGLMSFFLGWLVVEALSNRSLFSFSNAAWAALLAGLWSLTIAEAYTGVLSKVLAHLFETIAEPDSAAALTLMSLRFAMIFILFPMTILAIVLLESKKAIAWTEKLGLLGDLSYPVYLLHFPMQCVVILVSRQAGWLPGYADTFLFLLGFFAALFCAAALSAYRFEKPAQAWIRRALRRPQNSEAKW